MKGNPNSENLKVVSVLLLLTLPSFGENAAPPQKIFNFPPAPKRIHIAKGLWWQLFRVTEAGALMGGAIYGESFDVHGRTNYHGYGKTLGDFPSRPGEFFSHHVIVITGCRAGALNSKRQQQLKNWVMKGGGLLVTGGIQGLGRGNYSGTILEELLPAKISKEDDFTKTSPGAVLSPTAAGSRFFTFKPAWQQKPRLFYRHGDLALKSGAEVLLESDGHPALVTWKTGKGRVALFAGTVCGDPQPGELAFWEWDGWPLLLSQTLQWLANTPPAMPQDKAPIDKEYQAKLQQLKELTDLDVEGLFDEDEEEEEPVKGSEDKPGTLETITKLASYCLSSDYALAVIKALEESGTPIEIGRSEMLFTSISRHISGKKFANPAKALAASSNSGRAALGLRVLARAKSSDGKALALRYLSKGLAGLPGKGQSSGLAPAMQVETGEDERLRLAACRALADYSDQGLLASFRKSAAGWQQKNKPSPAIAELQKDLAEEIQLVLCLLGDGEAAVNVLNLMVRNRKQIDENLDVTQQPLYVPTPTLVKERKRLANEIPHLRARNSRLAATLAKFPQQELQILASNSAAWKSDQASEYLQACLARRSPVEDLSQEVRKALKQIIRECELSSVRTLCFRRLKPSPQEARGLLMELAKGSQAAALFSLSQCGELPESGRAPLINLSLEHRSRSVRHKAAHSIVLASPEDHDDLLKSAKAKSGSDEVMDAILSR